MRAAEVVSEVPTGARGWVRGAVAIAVIPGVKKGAFVFGARWGKGLLTMRDQDGNWIPPSFIQIGGGNFGLQAGFQNSDLVLIFTDEAAVRSLLTGKLTLNADAAAAAPVIGRNAVAGTPILLKGGIYSYSRSNGIFAGVSLDGSVITIDGTSNARVYGKYISGDAILLDRAVRSNEVVAPFLNAMQQVSPGPNASQPPAN